MELIHFFKKISFNQYNILYSYRTTDVKPNSGRVSRFCRRLNLLYSVVVAEPLKNS